MTLMEVSIASSLMVLVFLCVWMIVDKGVRFYRLNSDANDRQRDVLFFLSRLNMVMQNTQPALMFIDSASPAPPTGPFTYTNSRGISYCSPFNEAGQAKFDPVSRQLMWQAYGCFYLRPDGDVRWVRAMMATLTSPNAETISPPAPDATVPAFVPATFTGGTQGKLVARNVTNLEFRRHEVGEIQPNGRATQERFYDVVVECGKRNDPLGYWIQLKSSFYPRN